MYSRRHPLDLSSAMAICDGNYIRLLKLLPGLDRAQRRSFVLQAPGGDQALEQVVVLQVEERFRYTSTVSMCVHLAGPAPQYYRPPVMLVRLYHDASTAEVVSYQQQGAFHVRSLPGEAPEFSPDEKQQVNALLAEWLTLCLAQGLGRTGSTPQDPGTETVASST